MKDRTKLLNDYFQNVSKEELLADIEKTGMMNRKVSVPAHSREVTVSVGRLTPSVLSRSKRARGLAGRRRTPLKRTSHN
ncbi:MAG TPA: hypothetical protein VNS08_17185 [Ureibacillus sp.]|nr:hypothetical protein [Ureibacillus sp.]